MNKYILRILIIPSIILLSNTNILKSIDFEQYINNNQNDVDTAIFLINQNANINAQDKSGYNPLHLAVIKG